MWFQRKVAGVTAENQLFGPQRVALARRVAEAIHKLHRANVPADKQHTMVDELRILRECFDKVAALKPDWSPRLQRLLAACERLGAGVRPPVTCGIHRDFYSAQVIADGERLWLIDFDLYCIGDPGLDIGNFQAHMTESSLRELGNPQALHEQEQALENTFVSLAGERCRPAITAYKTLSLVRHIYLSTQFPERQRFTETLLEICEQRLGLAAQIRR